jgi:outer membrane lipoprotein-sorting protein
MEASDSRGRSPVVVGIVAFLLVAAAAVGAAALDTAPSGEQLLDDASDRYRTAETVVGTAEVTATNGSVTRTASVELAFARPNATRVSVTPREGPARTVGTNGSVAWAYNESTGQLRVVRKGADGNWSLDGVAGDGPDVAAQFAAGEDAPRNWGDRDEGNATAKSHPNVSRADLRAAWNETAWAREPGALAAAFDDNTTAERLGRAPVDGTDAYRLRVEPTNGSWNATVEVWVGVEDRRLLRSEITRDGWTTTTTYDLAVNASVHPSTFQPPTDRADTLFAPRTVDTPEAAAEAAGRDLPRLEAAGYDFASATVLERDGVTTVAQSYEATDGGTGVVLASADAGPDALPYTVGDVDADESDGSANASTVEIDGTTATVVQRGDRTAVVWTTDRDGETHTVAVVARLPSEDVIDLAASVG